MLKEVMCVYLGLNSIWLQLNTQAHLYSLVRAWGPFTLGLALLVKDSLLQGAKSTELRRIIKNGQ